MSPITAAARARLMDYMREHVKPNQPPPPEPSTLLRLINDLIAAVRGEQPGDRPF